MSKGQIYGESRKKFRYIQILIKLDNELSWEIREIFIFKNKTWRRIHIIKNHSIYISIRREIKEQNKEWEINHEERELDKISKKIA